MLTFCLNRESNNAISVQITELTKTNDTLGADMRRNFETLYQKLEEMEKRSSSIGTNVSNEPSTVVGPGPTNRQDHPPQNLGIFGSVKRYILGSATLQNKTPRNEETQQQHPGSDDVQSMEAMRLWPDLHKLLSSLCTTASLVAKDQKILNSLYDPSLMNRYFTVDEEYKYTFRWIFDNLDHGYPQWLESGSGVYWVTGKAGSGKSTLMKFILDNPRTEEILRGWAGDSDLLLINHFFWAAGAELQKSYDGLIRSLLFQILRQRPALIQKLCPRRIDGDEFTRQEPWTFPELSRTFQSLTEDGTLDAYVCIFVDGLDEYDGTPADVIKILTELASYPNLKLCVSSRPWPVFKKEFGQSIEQLRMEDLTRSDIDKYVKGRLSEDHFCRQILRDNLEYEFGIVWQITISAEGVFLWVRYVVNMLLRETANEPTVSDLENLVRRYPRGLDSLYERMLQMALESYPQESAELLQVLTTFNGYTYALLPFFIELQRASEKEIDWQAEAKSACLPKIEARLKARCMDFVEVRPWFYWEGAGDLGPNTASGPISI